MCKHVRCVLLIVFFFFNDTATTEIYTLSLHDALPILNEPTYTVSQVYTATTILAGDGGGGRARGGWAVDPVARGAAAADRKSTRLNSSHANISYAVFCLKKKK